MSEDHRKEVEHAIRNWIDDFIIKHEICPFAKKPYLDERIHYQVINEIESEVVLQLFWHEIEFMAGTSPDRISNTLFIVSKGFEDFQDFLELYHTAEQLLQLQNRSEDFQLALFHPKFYFQSSTPDQKGNRVNQSPFPAIHILRVTEVSEAIASFGDTTKISERNRRNLERMD